MQMQTLCHSTSLYTSNCLQHVSSDLLRSTRLLFLNLALDAAGEPYREQLSAWCDWESIHTDHLRRKPPSTLPEIPLANSGPPPTAAAIREHVHNRALTHLLDPAVIRPYEPKIGPMGKEHLPCGLIPVAWTSSALVLHSAADRVCQILLALTCTLISHSVASDNTQAKHPICDSCSCPCVRRFPC